MKIKNKFVEVSTTTNAEGDTIAVVVRLPRSNATIALNDVEARHLWIALDQMFAPP